MLRTRRTEHELQADREVERAEALLTDLFDVSAEEASVALREEAAATGVSVHAAALAVVANWATKSPVLGRMPQRQ
jgi:AmiR/NasT family two-component response regulator